MPVRRILPAAKFGLAAHRGHLACRRHLSGRHLCARTRRRPAAAAAARQEPAGRLVVRIQAELIDAVCRLRRKLGQPHLSVRRRAAHQKQFRPAIRLRQQHRPDAATGRRLPRRADDRSGRRQLRPGLQRRIIFTSSGTTSSMAIPRCAGIRPTAPATGVTPRACSPGTTTARASSCRCRRRRGPAPAASVSYASQAIPSAASRPTTIS